MYKNTVYNKNIGAPDMNANWSLYFHVSVDLSGASHLRSVSFPFRRFIAIKFFSVTGFRIDLFLRRPSLLCLIKIKINFKNTSHVKLSGCT